MRTTALLIVAAVLAGCTAAPEQSALTTPPPPPPPSPTTTTPFDFPQRPRAVPLDAVDPCAVLTEEQRVSLSLDNPPSPYVEPSFGSAKACTIRSTTSGNVARIALVLVSGADVWLSENAQVDYTVGTIEGFTAITVRTPDVHDVCNVEIDVADGQFLDVMFRDGGNSTAVQQDHLCLGAQRVAEAAMASLLQSR
ncbi:MULTISPECIES: DUF3558 domain-containing protein [Lentzea]|uniref:DUF3558 domain-containing protein n=1 Tax=Lentzea albida TaxID=65499 RepID=A0A1H9IDS7_9PSEU|nr:MULTISPECIES: DUF3558 domain-containing protein [Lentzea]USX50909.1 DUF3558 domain-containing protein [Lentzea sp. HUAS12]SEQ72891.1 Protein of unknown function [Lentzea albida]